MDQKIKEIYSLYASNPNNMKLNEFKHFITDTKICKIYESEPKYIRYSVNREFSLYSFKYALEEIKLTKNINYDDILDKILNKSKEEELKQIEKKKKEILLRQENLKINKNKKQTEKVKEILEDMCFMGSTMKKEIINEKNNNPGKFISIEEAAKNENDINFCLSVLAQNLENIGITTAIEKEANNDEESIKSSEMVIQFIMNGMSTKKKYDLHFDFGAIRNNELLNNKLEQEKFHKKLRKSLSKEYNIPEEEIIITNPQKGSYNIQVIFMSEEFNKIIDISKFQQKCQNSNDSDELKYLKEVHQTLIMEGCKLNRNMLDSKGNRISGWAIGEKRGGKDYIPPEGWMGFGLKVVGKYDNGNDDWLACNGNNNEWAVAYHGVRTIITPKLEDAVKNISINGFQTGKNHKYKNSVNSNDPGNKIGIGIYCSPNPKVLEFYANQSTSETTINGKHFMMGFMMRVKPDKIRIPPEQPDYWILNGTTDEMRPYRILVKEK